MPFSYSLAHESLSVGTLQCVDRCGLFNRGGSTHKF